MIKPSTDRLNNWFTSKFNITINEESMDSQEQTLQFADQMPHWRYVVDSPMESTYGVCDNPQDDLDKFFSRPLKIRTYTWAVGATLFEAFNPWSDFFNNPRVINRVCNYMNLRCTLHVKFLINGNGFHYGKAIASYIPLHVTDNVTKDRAFFRQDIIAASQRPKIFLDPTKSKGGELVLPFFWPANNLSIPDTEWDNMGEIVIHGINALKHANGSTDSVNVSVFVWAENVHLSTPTSAEPGTLQAQSGDEYGQGAISKPLAVMARIAGMLVNAPVVGAYAKATQLAASSMSNMAQIFGYSRPNVIADIISYKPTYVGNMVNTQISDTAVKLTNDPKQELTIDSTTMGLGRSDEMTINSIAMRESYLTTFPWSTAKTTESFLFQTKVTPVLWDELAISGQTEYHLPACAYASLPFGKWRGTMKFRFQIVASAYHKGRLKIVYDPFAAVSNEYNTNFTHIVDLAKERDFAVEIGWGHPKSYCITEDIVAATALPFSSVLAPQIPSTTSRDSNGYLTLYVVNELTTPNSTVNNDVDVNVFVSVCDDFEIADPTDRTISQFSVFPDKLVAQSGDETTDLCQPDCDRNPDEDMPMNLPVQHTLAPSLSPSDHTGEVYFGDPIVSFRQALKRYNYVQTFVPTSGAISTNVLRITQSNFPVHRGFAPDGLHNVAVPVDPTPFTYAKMTLLNYISVGFGAYRGGIRWKATAHGTNPRSSKLLVTRLSASADYTPSTTTIPLSPITAINNQRINQYVNASPSGQEGMHMTQYGLNSALEYEIPFFDSVRFYPTKRVSTFNDILNKDLVNYHSIFYHYLTSTIETPHLNTFVSTGEDFNLAFYLGPPVFYNYTNPSPSLTVPAT